MKKFFTILLLTTFISRVYSQNLPDETYRYSLMTIKENDSEWSTETPVIVIAVFNDGVSDNLSLEYTYQGETVNRTIIRKADVHINNQSIDKSEWYKWFTGDEGGTPVIVSLYEGRLEIYYLSTGKVIKFKN